MLTAATRWKFCCFISTRPICVLVRRPSRGWQSSSSLNTTNSTEYVLRVLGFLTFLRHIPNGFIRDLFHIVRTPLYSFISFANFAGCVLMVAPESIWKIISCLSRSMRHLAPFLCFFLDFTAFTQWAYSSSSSSDDVSRWCTRGREALHLLLFEMLLLCLEALLSLLGHFDSKLSFSLHALHSLP